jgi:hypothetical protein
MTEERSIMLTAFVLTKTEIGSKFDVLEKLKKSKAPKKHTIYGEFMT